MVERALPALGFEGVRNVRVGRLIELEVDDPGAAARDVRAAAREPADRGLRGARRGRRTAGRAAGRRPAVKFGVMRSRAAATRSMPQLAASRVGEAVLLWHADHDLQGVDAVIVPGGFSYGDYLRAGAIARFAPIMAEVIEFAREGGLVLGICNGFQVCCEAGLLPGALLDQHRPALRLPPGALEVVNARHAVHPRAAPRASGCRSRSSTRPAATTRRREMLDAMRARRAGRAALRARARTPTARSTTSPASCNEAGNVFGLMPHPEHAVDPLTGSADGLGAVRLAGRPASRLAAPRRSAPRPPSWPRARSRSASPSPSTG